MVIDKQILEESEHRHHNFISKMFFSGSKDVEGAELFWHDKINDKYSNFASHINTKDSKNLLVEVKKFYKSMNRKPSVFITPFTNPDMTGELKKQGFKLKYRKSWMFLNEPIKAEKPEFKITGCTSMDYMKMFARTFNNAYSGTGPKEPYGKAPPEWSEAIIESFHTRNDGRTVKYFLGLWNGMPVSVGIIAYDNAFGGIYALGTIPDMRGKGVGTLMTLHCISELKKAGIRYIFLQTTTDSYNERFYKKLGFITEFVGQGWVFDG